MAFYRFQNKNAENWSFLIKLYAFPDDCVTFWTILFLMSRYKIYIKPRTWPTHQNRNWHRLNHGRAYTNYKKQQEKIHETPKSTNKIESRHHNVKVLIYCGPSGLLNSRYSRWHSNPEICQFWNVFDELLTWKKPF